MCRRETLLSLFFISDPHCKMPSGKFRKDSSTIAAAKSSGYWSSVARPRAEEPTVIAAIAKVFRDGKFVKVRDIEAECGNVSTGENSLELAVGAISRVGRFVKDEGRRREEEGGREAER